MLFLCFSETADNWYFWCVSFAGHHLIVQSHLPKGRHRQRERTQRKMWKNKRWVSSFVGEHWMNESTSIKVASTWLYVMVLIPNLTYVSHFQTNARKIYSMKLKSTWEGVNKKTKSMNVIEWERSQLRSAVEQVCIGEYCKRTRRLHILRQVAPQVAGKVWSLRVFCRGRGSSCTRAPAWGSQAVSWLFWE